MKPQSIQSKKTSVQKTGQLFEKMDILKLFFHEPEKSFHLRELARILNTSPSTISKSANELVSKDILKSESSRGFKLYKANTENPNFKEAKILYNITHLRESGLLIFLTEKLNYPKTIILFGSFRKGDNIPESDIDIFIETSSKKELNLEEYERKLGRKIHLFQLSPNEIQNMKIKNKELLNNIINGIVLDGFFEVFK